MSNSQSRTGTINKKLYIAAGHTFIGLGVIGAILPVMPTTIFLLLAAACYAKSSPRLYAWLLNNKWLGPYVKNYKDKQGISLSMKLFSSLILWAGILFTVFFTEQKLWVNILLLAVAAAISIHIWMIKTYKPDSSSE